MTKTDIGYELKKIFRVIFYGELVRDWMQWGTYGISGKEPLRWVLLMDITNEHIQAILDTQPHITSFYRKEFKNELKLRTKNPLYSKPEKTIK